MKNVKIAVFGEILWDIFGEEKTIGGAPFNFAAHASRLGAEVGLVSAVGRDELGDAAVTAAKGFGVDTENIARVDAPTGYCRVTLSDGKPSYELVRGVAYDMIPPPEGEIAADAFYFGTLAARSGVSASTLSSLLDGDYREIFFDINIRQNYYTEELIDASLRRATIFKLSREEMGVLGFGNDEVDLCRKVSERYANLRLVILTLDRDGALVYETATGLIYRSPKPTSPAVSTVGAGDSFSACFLVNYLRGTGIEDSLRRATALSDYVVTQLGAVPDYPAALRGEIM